MGFGLSHQGNIDDHKRRRKRRGKRHLKTEQFSNEHQKLLLDYDGYA